MHVEKLLNIWGDMLIICLLHSKKKYFIYNWYAATTPQYSKLQWLILFRDQWNADSSNPISRAISILYAIHVP